MDCLNNGKKCINKLLMVGNGSALYFCQGQLILLWVWEQMRTKWSAHLWWALSKIPQVLFNRARNFQHRISKYTRFLYWPLPWAIAQSTAVQFRCFNFAMLKVCKIKLKLRFIFQFTHSRKTSASVWAVTSEIIVPRTKEEFQQKGFATDY